MTGDQGPQDRVCVTVSLRVDPARAFAAFTTETDLWWRRGPAWRVAGRQPGTLSFEPGPQGRLIERFASAAGEQAHVAGRILAWEPPSLLRFEWRGVNFAAHERTEVEVRFEAVPTGTRLTLVHTGFSSLRPDHPVRHGQPPRAFLAGMGQWWGGLLTSLRQHTM